MINAMTVDIEDYFQVSAFEEYISRKDWDSIPTRVEANIDVILSLFDEKDIKATFFILGWIAERHPGIVRQIIANGHEVASHGYSHTRIVDLTPDEFRDDILKTNSILEDLCGMHINGYRAPSYSIVKDNLWAHDILEECGFLYSTSVYPIKHDLYGIPDAPRFSYRVGSGKLIEIPISTLRFMGKTIPCGGGGFFRLFPYQFSRFMIKHINRVEKMPCIFYFHPWEIDTLQPRQSGIDMKTRIRHYTNLGRMEDRLRRLLQDFDWDRMDSVFASDISQTEA